MMTLLLSMAATVAAPAHSGFPKLEAYRLCGVDAAAKLARDLPGRPAEILARNATMQCDHLIGPAAEETIAKTGLPQDRRPRIVADYRQRSIADLAHKITTLRASKK